MIDEITKHNIIESTDIVSLVEENVQLKKQGSGFVGCCPFHNEKTGSFSVSPSRQTFHCFGCGAKGDAVEYIMKRDGLNFHEALLALAKRAGIKVDEKPLTAEEIARNAKRETMLMINQKVNEFFVSQLELNPEAKAYAYKRWKAEYVNEMGIGYAPDSKTFMDWINGQGFNHEVLVELKLVGINEKGGEYAFFRNRVTIPIRSRSNMIIGFTCRDMEGKDKTAKYLNSAESELYHKKDTLFGIDEAKPEIRATGKVYVCEGAPDVMRLQIIGFKNAVAPLGTGTVSDSQFSLLDGCFPKMGNKTLCICPDADITKDDGTNPGMETAIKIGKLACRHGYVVTIKPIPNDDNKEKKDPDSFFKSKKIFQDTHEEDFITWYANKLFDGTNSVESQNSAVTEIVTLVSDCDDEVRQEAYMRALKSTYKETAVWNKALKSVKEEKKAAEIREKAFSKDDFTKYGFYEVGNSYWSLKGTTETRWSNFTMKPLFHIKDAINPKRLYSIKNENNETEIVELKQEDLVSLSKFRQRIEGLGNYIFEANEDCLIKLKRYLYEQTETAQEIIQLGWQKQGFYAFGNGILYQGKFHKTDNFGIVRLDEGNYYLPGASDIYKEDTLFQFEKRFVHLNYNPVSLTDVAEAMIRVFHDNAIIGLCFLVATLFRDVVTSHTKSFPMLNLFGPKGSGKSELGHTLMSFFIIQNIPPNLSNSTIAALSEAVAQCANAIVHLDEFKNNIDIDKREFLKGLWDSAGRTRMNMDRDKKREQTRVDSGVIISGQEMATADIALFSRFVYLTFNKTEFTTSETNAFHDMDRMRKLGFSHLTIQILNNREVFKQNFAAMYNAVMTDITEKLGNEICESRIINNWAIMAAAFRTLEQQLNLPFSYNKVLEICVAGIIRQNGECKSNNEIAGFWNVVSYMQQTGDLIMDCDYKIEYVEELKTTKSHIIFATVKPILFMRKKKAFFLYKKLARQCGENPLPEGSLDYYLQNSKEFLGIKKSIRFKTMIQGKEQMVMDKDNIGKVTASQVDQAMCFDYKKIVENFEISLEISPDENN